MTFLARIPALLALACTLAVPANAQAPARRALLTGERDTATPAAPAAAPDTTLKPIPLSEIPGAADRAFTRAYDLSGTAAGGGTNTNSGSG